MRSAFDPLYRYGNGRLLSFRDQRDFENGGILCWHYFECSSFTHITKINFKIGAVRLERIPVRAITCYVQRRRRGAFPGAEQLIVCRVFGFIPVFFTGDKSSCYEKWKKYEEFFHTGDFWTFSPVERQRKAQSYTPCEIQLSLPSSSVNPKVEPTSTLLRTLIVWSCASTICFTMASPRPVPPISRLRARSVR